MVKVDRANRSVAARYFSPRELAAAIGVSESSLKRWADEGRLAVERTAGGHRRIALAEAVRFVRQAGLAVVRPELLGPAAVGVEWAQGELTDTADERLFRALLGDHAAEARSLIVSHYLEGASLGWLFDGPIRCALERMGEMWSHDERGIFLEHRATETCLRALGELRPLLPRPHAGSPVAIGGAYGGDVYQVPSTMAALVLAEAGFHERNLGADTPVEAILAAIRHYHPRIVWQSFSAPLPNPRSVLSSLERIVDAMGPAVLVVGGRASASVPLPASASVHRLDSMTELAAFARGLRSPAVES